MQPLASLPLAQPEPQAGSVRLGLTSRAPMLLRRHAGRAAIRVLVLALLDLATTLMSVSIVRLMVEWAMRQAPGSAALAWLTGSAGPLELSVLVAVALALKGCYGPNDARRDSGAIGGAVALGLALALWARGGAAPLSSWILGFLVLWLAIATGLVVERKIVDLAVRIARPGDRGASFAVVVGSAGDAEPIIDHPALGENPWCHLAAFLDPSRFTANELAGELARVIRENRIDTVILGGHLDADHLPAVVDVAVMAGCQLFSLPRVPLGSTVLPSVQWRNGYPVVELTRPGLVGLKLVIKRAIDLVGAAVGLIVLAPLLLAIGFVVRLTSPGPVLFRQARIGRGGKRFTIYKFRTMAEDAESHRSALSGRSVYQDPRLFKLEFDPRVTPVGAFLRRTSLDELPQLFNVLRGEMSLVGPRPPLPNEVALYAGHHYARFDVKPGVTGPWQVSGRNSIRDFEKVIRLETAYIRRWSLTLDLELLLRTIPAVLSRRGAH